MAGRTLIPGAHLVAIKPVIEGFLKIDEREIKVIQSMNFPNARTAVDIGANWGSYTVMLARKFEKVIAFEPIHKCAEALKSYAGTYKKQIVVHEMALSDKSRTAEFIQEKEQSGSGDRTGFSHLCQPGEIPTHTIQSKTLDSLGLVDVDFIKIDVEGHEEKVIRGSLETIHRYKPIMLVEIEQRHINKDIRSVISYVEELGYRTYICKKNLILPASQFNVTIDQDELSLAKNKEEYINNFFFFPINDSEKI